MTDSPATMEEHTYDGTAVSGAASPSPTLGQNAPPRGDTRLRICLLLAVVLVTYSNSLFNSFTMDDELYILRNPQVTQHSLRLLFSPNVVSNVFRPVTFATLALNWMVAGYKPFGYHLVNLLLHAGVTVLLFLLLRRLLAGLSGTRFVPFAAAALFALHPLHTEAVSSVVGRAELLAAGFLLAAWLFHLADRYVLALICFVLALLSKESAIGLLPLAFVGDFATRKMKTWTRYAAVALLTVTYIAALWKIQGGHFGASGVSVLDNPLTLLPGGLRVLNALRIAWKYVALLLLPATLSCDYSYNQIPLYADVRHLLLPVTAALLLFAGWFCILARRKLPGYAIAGAIFFAGFAATSNLLTRTGTIFAERLAYLPSAGFCLIVALLLGRLERRHRLAALVLLSVLAVALGVRAVVRNQDWRDNATLYSAAARAVPNSAKMRAFRGAVYVGRNQFDLARADLQTALRIYPEFPDAIETLGLLETRAGNSAEALRLLKQAFDMSDRKDIDYDYRAVNLAALQLQLGKPTDALTLLNTLIAESPGYSRAWSNRAVARLQLGQLDAAREDARTALRLDPNNAQAFAVFHRADRPLP